MLFVSSPERWQSQWLETVAMVPSTQVWALGFSFLSATCHECLVAPALVPRPSGDTLNEHHHETLPQNLLPS